MTTSPEISQALHDSIKAEQVGKEKVWVKNIGRFKSGAKRCSSWGT